MRGALESVIRTSTSNPVVDEMRCHCTRCPQHPRQVCANIAAVRLVRAEVTVQFCVDCYLLPAPAAQRYRSERGQEPGTRGRVV